MGSMFQGKVALVTGGSSGIGRSTALAFAEEGAKVVVSDVLAAGGEETVQMIKEVGDEKSHPQETPRRGARAAHRRPRCAASAFRQIQGVR